MLHDKDWIVSFQNLYVEVLTSNMALFGGEIYYEVISVKWGHSACVCAKSLLLCLTLCDSMDCSLPGFSVHAIL